MSFIQSFYATSGGGGGGGANTIELTQLRLADVVATSDPSGWLTGAITETGGTFTFPVSSAANLARVSAAVRLDFALPAAFAPGSGNGGTLFTVTEFVAVTGDWTAAVGYVDPVDGSALISGLRHVKLAPGEYEAMCAVWAGSAIDPVNIVASTARGSIAIVPTLDGTGSDAGGWSLLTDGTDSSIATEAAAGTPNPTRANTKICAAIGHATTSADTESVQARFWYAYVPFP